jgi:hypothetical protein
MHLPRKHLLLGVWAAGMLLSAPLMIHAEWIDTRTIDLFHVRSEFKLSDAQSRLLQEELGQLRQDIETLLGFPFGQQPVELNLFSSKRSYQKFLSVRVPEGVSRPALFVQGTDLGRVYIYSHRGFETDLRHECTHAILHSELPYVPMWLDEGLAEYFEVPADQRASGNPHLFSVRRAMLLRWQPDLRNLEAAQALDDMQANEYRDSWAWTHYFLHGPMEARQVLSNHIHDIRTGQVAGSLSDRLAADSSEIPVDIVEHFRSWK